MAAFVEARSLGKVLVAGIPIRLWARKMRVPDIAFMRAENASRRREQFWDGADLVVEIVSPDDPRRDLETKRDEYALAGIPEYWIVDPMAERILVLRLDGRSYEEHGEFVRGMWATSAILPDFAVSVDEVLDSAR